MENQFLNTTINVEVDNKTRVVNTLAVANESGYIIYENQFDSKTTKEEALYEARKAVSSFRTDNTPTDKKGNFVYNRTNCFGDD